MKWFVLFILFFSVNVMKAQEERKTEDVRKEIQQKNKKMAPPPPPPPPPPPKKKEIFKVVEDMPRYYSENCEALSTKKERQMCAQQAMLKYIYSKLEYPVIAKGNEIDGTVVINFIVGDDGMIRDVKILKDIGAGCGEEAMRVVKLMPQWVPGRQRGTAVSVYFNLPIMFKLPKEGTE